MFVCPHGVFRRGCKFESKVNSLLPLHQLLQVPLCRPALVLCLTSSEGFVSCWFCSSLSSSSYLWAISLNKLTYCHYTWPTASVPDLCTVPNETCLVLLMFPFGCVRSRNLRSSQLTYLKIAKNTLALQSGGSHQSAPGSSEPQPGWSPFQLGNPLCSLLTRPGQDFCICSSSALQNKFFLGLCLDSTVQGFSS